MKQFLTLCMATAMIGSALNADAKVSFEKAMQLKSEGKALTQVLKTRNTKAIKTLKHAPVSGFHKMMAQKDAKFNGRKAPAKVTPLGDDIYGYLGYSDDPGTMPVGYYELEESSANLVWADPFYEENMLACINTAKVGDKIVGYIQDSFWGMLFGVYYIEYDAQTGEPIAFDEQDLAFNPNYISTFAYNPETETFYGYGVCDGVQAYVSAPAAEPFNYSLIKALEGREMCMSICYNPEEDAIYGVNLDYEFVRVENDGSQTKIMDLDVPDGATYITGLVYEPKSKLYYWNINYNDDSSAMATIDAANQELNVYANLEYCEEYMNLFTTTEYVGNPNIPARPVAGTPDFYKGNLIGIVPFTLPSVNKGGEALTGKVEYTTYLNGELYSTGSGEPGQEVRTSFAVPEPGKYSFSMKAKIKVDGEYLESSAASASTWVGNDVPVAPANVKMTTSKVTWDAVTEGLHGGYVDLKAMSYEVVVSNDEEKVGETVYTSYDIELPEDQELSAYVAYVRAVCNEFKSDWVSSNPVTAGLALELPQYIMPTPDEYALSVILDNNKDGVTWYLNQDYYDEENPYYIQTSYTYSADEPMDDWYFLPKMKFDDPARFYSFSMQVALRSTYYANEYVEVLLCNDTSLEGMSVVGTIIDEFAPEGITYETVSGEFRVRQAGDYYIAIHCTSDGDQLGINARNFAVEDNNITFASPVAVENIDVTPGANGALKATVKFDMPEMNMGDGEIDPATELTASVITPVDEQVVKGKPGETVEVEVETEQGYNTFLVTVSDGEFNSPTAKAVAYTGYDLPATPVMSSVEYSEDMLSMTLNWEAVTTPDEPEGVINPETVTYDIYMVVPGILGNNWALYEQGVEGTSYTYEVAPGEVQDMVQLGVASRNEAGSNGYLTSAMGILGTPYDLPIEEDFDDEGNIYTNPWITYTDTYDEGLSAQWGLYYDSAITGNEDDTNVSMIVQGEEGAISRLGTPRFTTKGLTDATLALELFNTDMPKTSILAVVAGEEPEEIAVINGNDFKNDIEKVAVDLPAKYLGQDWVGLFIRVEFEEESQILAIESIGITSVSGVATIANNGVKIAGGKGQIKVTGLNGQDVTVANVNGAVVAKSAKANNEAIFNVEKGVYVVLAGDKKAKVVVK